MAFEDFHTNFDGELDSRLSWHETAIEKGIPKRVECCPGGEPGLLVYPHGKTDYWRKTYYSPLLEKYDGHLLGITVSSPPMVVAETSFKLDVKQQFDQAGLMVYVDDDHWLKTGLEFSDGQIYLGCVTTNVYSDWSTQEWANNELSIRLYILSNDSCVVEALYPDGTWKMIRVCHLTMGTGTVKVGLYSCAPTAEGSSTVFRNLSIKATKGHAHHA